MTLLEMSVFYAESADRIRLRMAQLQAAERAERDPEAARRLRLRVESLRPMLREMRELAALTGRSESDERLLDYIGKIPDTCVVIFYVQGKVDARKKLAAALKKQGTVVSFAPLEDAALNAWIVRTAKNLGKEIAMGDAAYLSFTVGTDAATIKGELEKLASLAGERPTITREDIQAVCTRSMECTVFEMVTRSWPGRRARPLGFCMTCW